MKLCALSDDVVMVLFRFLGLKSALVLRSYSDAIYRLYSFEKTKSWYVTWPVSLGHINLNPNEEQAIILSRIYKYTPEIIRSNINIVLHCALIKGRLLVLRWLTEEFKFTSDDVRPYDNFALRSLCARVNDDRGLEAIQWFVSTFKSDVRSDNDAVFRFACGMGHLKVAQWIAEKYKITSDGKELCNDAYRRSCVNGHFHVARWLAKKFQLISDDTAANSKHLFQNACASGYLELAQWFVSEFNLTTEDMRARDDYALESSNIKGHKHVFRWLMSKFE